MIRTSLPADTLGTGGAVESYKELENVERVFCGLNTDLLDPAHPAPARAPGPRPRADPPARLLRPLRPAGGFPALPGRA